MFLLKRNLENGNRVLFKVIKIFFFLIKCDGFWYIERIIWRENKEFKNYYFILRKR